MNRHTLAVVVLLAVACSEAVAQPAPFPPSFNLDVTYPDYPQGGGTFPFTWDGQQYVHATSTTSGIIGAVPEWGLPQLTDGGINFALTQEYVDFSATWLTDGRLRIDHIHHPTIQITGPGNLPEPSLALPLLGLALYIKSRHTNRA